MLRCFRKHKLKDPKGKEEEEEEKQLREDIMYSAYEFYKFLAVRVY
jgi:hypothetical protein